MTEYLTDKLYPHGYLDEYTDLAQRIGNPAAAVCEVGVMQGGSLDLWQHMFPDGTVIGVDNNPNAVWPPGTHRIVAEQDDPALAGMVREYAPDGCDLIVDDASHIGHLTRATFATLWPLVRPGGFYVVEDWADMWVFPGWPRWQDMDAKYKGDELIDFVPELIHVLKDDASEVRYHWLGLAIVRRHVRREVKMP